MVYRTDDDHGGGAHRQEMDDGGRNQDHDSGWYHPESNQEADPRAEQRPDERLLKEISERLSRHAQIDSASIEVGVDKGVVTLTGSVDSDTEKYLAETTAESIPGVQHVENRLHVSQPGGDEMS